VVHRVARVLMQHALRQQHGVDVELELEKDGEQARVGKGVGRLGQRGGELRAREKRPSREERCLCAYQLAHICREDREYARSDVSVWAHAEHRSAPGTCSS
jgi:hypothetical protein